ncbi:hypothetical protein KC19_12G065400 [Ceratodon purpureus]|uniref:Uncharacterized protein n=1 Tax=Ceratodon purpureus TaxID=3225 RepID=A0A8T0G510_CERPU|nr:hypothetical protein KC19_12G065400 [Ceratodon purpureus]
MSLDCTTFRLSLLFCGLSAAHVRVSPVLKVKGMGNVSKIASESWEVGFSLAFEERQG